MAAPYASIPTTTPPAKTSVEECWVGCWGSLFYEKNYLVFLLHKRHKTLNGKFRYIDQAIAREKQLKKWSQKKKKALIHDYTDRLPTLASKRFD